MSKCACYPIRCNWGTKWRTPTIDEINQLLDDTKCEWTWDAAKKGFTVKGLKTGNSIFLPAAGYRSSSYLHDDGEYSRYWSSSVEGGAELAYALGFCLDDHNWYNGLRYSGRSVRAVTEY